MVEHVIIKSNYSFSTITGIGIKNYKELNKLGLIPDNDEISAMYQYKDPTTMVYIKNSRGKYIGWAVFKYLIPLKSRQRYGIVGVYVDPEYRGKGLAIKALKILKEKIRQTSLKSPVVYGARSGEKIIKKVFSEFKFKYWE